MGENKMKMIETESKNGCYNVPIKSYEELYGKWFWKLENSIECGNCQIEGSFGMMTVLTYDGYTMLYFYNILHANIPDCYCNCHRAAVGILITGEINDKST